MALFDTGAWSFVIGLGLVWAGALILANVGLPRQLKTGDTVCFAPESRTIDLVDADGMPMDSEMQARAASYSEPDWPRTGTVKDLINSHLSDAEDGCAVY